MCKWETNLFSEIVWHSNRLATNFLVSLLKNNPTVNIVNFLKQYTPCTRFQLKSFVKQKTLDIFSRFFFLPSHQNREFLDFEECACLNPIYSYKNILVSTIRISIHENRNYNQPCMGLGTKNNIHSKFINEHRVLNNIKYTHSFIFFKPSSEVFLFSP